MYSGHLSTIYFTLTDNAICFLVAFVTVEKRSTYYILLSNFVPLDFYERYIYVIVVSSAKSRYKDNYLGHEEISQVSLDLTCAISC